MYWVFPEIISQYALDSHNVDTMFLYSPLNLYLIILWILDLKYILILLLLLFLLLYYYVMEYVPCTRYLFFAIRRDDKRLMTVNFSHDRCHQWRQNISSICMTMRLAGYVTKLQKHQLLLKIRY